MTEHLFQPLPSLDNLEVSREYSEDLRVLRTGRFGDHWVIDGEVAHEFAGYYARSNAYLCAELLRRGGSVEPNDEEFIPVTTACLGRPAIAAYLRCVHHYTKGEISDLLDVQKKTVAQYLSDFRSRRA